MRFPASRSTIVTYLAGGATLLSLGSLGIAAGVVFLSTLTTGARGASRPAEIGLLLAIGGLLVVVAGGYGFFRGLQAGRMWIEVTDREFVWHRGNRIERLPWDAIADVSDMDTRLVIRGSRGTLEVPNEYANFAELVALVKRRGR